MSNFFKIFTIFLAILMVAVTVIFMALNMPFINAVDSFGTIVVTIAVFVIIAVCIIITTIKKDQGHWISIILCLVLLVIPIRGFIASEKLQDPFEHIQVELVSYEHDYVNHKYVTLCGLKYINETGVDIQDVKGKLSFYEGTTHIVTFDVDADFGLTEDGSGYIVYSLENDYLYEADYDDLTIIYTYECIQGGIHDYEYEPKEVKLK